jgi:hydrogenase-4 membrane subunit HyfE
MTVPTTLEQAATLLSYLMVVLALAISAAGTLKQMIRLYRWQAWLLAVVVLLTAVGPGPPGFAVAFLALIPVAMALSIRPLLARASLAEGPPGPLPVAGRPARLASLRASLREAPGRAELIWLQHGGSRLPGGLSAAVDLVLIATAFLVASRLAPSVQQTAAGGDATPSLATSIALLLQGLFTMSAKRDIVAQVIGLLVMEHGLFLAAVRVAPPALAPMLVVSLFCYVLVTLTILLLILPALHRASRSIHLTDNRHLRG